MSTSKSYWLHALTPLHVGVGFGAGYIDLPIVREKITEWPYVPGSAVKGVIADREGAPEDRTGDAARAFGTGGDDLANAGALVFTDARIVCLPVQSLYGTWAWVTSPLALGRLARDVESLASLALPLAGESSVKVAGGGTQLSNAGMAFLADLDLSAEEDTVVTEWAKKLAGFVFPGDEAWQRAFRERFAVVSDNNFTFLCQTACEISARIRISKDTKTVEKGALWYEEALPAECILAGFVWCDGIYKKRDGAKDLLEKYCRDPLTLQVGGKATVGRGRCRVLFNAGGL